MQTLKTSFRSIVNMSVQLVLRIISNHRSIRILHKSLIYLKGKKESVRCGWQARNAYDLRVARTSDSKGLVITGIRE